MINITNSDHYVLMVGEEEYGLTEAEFKTLWDKNYIEHCPFYDCADCCQQTYKLKDENTLPTVKILLAKLPRVKTVFKLSAIIALLCLIGGLLWVWGQYLLGNTDYERMLNNAITSPFDIGFGVFIGIYYWEMIKAL